MLHGLPRPRVPELCAGGRVKFEWKKQGEDGDYKAEANGFTLFVADHGWRYAVWTGNVLTGKRLELNGFSSYAGAKWDRRGREASTRRGQQAAEKFLTDMLREHTEAVTAEVTRAEREQHVRVVGAVAARQAFNALPSLTKTQRAFIRALTRRTTYGRNKTLGTLWDVVTFAQAGLDLFMVARNGSDWVVLAFWLPKINDRMVPEDKFAGSEAGAVSHLNAMMKRATAKVRT